MKNLLRYEGLHEIAIVGKLLPDTGHYRIALYASRRRTPVIVTVELLGIVGSFLSVVSDYYLFAVSGHDLIVFEEGTQKSLDGAGCEEIVVMEQEHEIAGGFPKAVVNIFGQALASGTANIADWERRAPCKGRNNLLSFFATQVVTDHDLIGRTGLGKPRLKRVQEIAWASVGGNA